MQASQSEIHAFLLEYSGAQNRVQSGKFKRDQLRLEFEGGSPTTVKLRDLRTSCCMIDLGSSIFTLNFRDITGFSIPNDPGIAMPVLHVRLGCLARDMNARMARDTRRSSWFDRSEGHGYTQPRHNDGGRHVAGTAQHQAQQAGEAQGIPLNPPGGIQFELSDSEPAPYNRVKREAQPDKARAPRDSASQRHSLDEIEQMLKALWKEPKA